MEVTLGGNRLGSGNKNKIALHDYQRSTHNLSQKFTSSMQVGTLYPFLVIPAMRGDKFDIELKADARTIPTKGPLFGSFKMQMDIFQCDARLYQAILHNNPLAIGMKMSQVKFPRLQIRDNITPNAFSNSSLLKYLGMSGLGGRSVQTQSGTITRQINAIPALAYYEIFKTYYANKQEDNAYVIGTEKTEGSIRNFTFILNNDIEDQVGIEEKFIFRKNIRFQINFNDEPHNGKEWQKNLFLTFYGINIVEPTEPKRLWASNLESALKEGWVKQIGVDKYVITELPVTPVQETPAFMAFTDNWSESQYTYIDTTRGLEPFPLANIDAMRLKLLSFHTLNRPFKITDGNGAQADEWNKTDGESNSLGLPYTNLVSVDGPIGEEDTKTKNCNALNGLVVKTYQSDLFNNWVNTDWIEGENGIAEITAISTSDGSIKIDAINFAEKLYNMLNRIAVSDGSYEGWQDAVYTDTPRRHIESPIYLGGMSSEIVFEEIVQTSASTADNPLGSLGGKGKLLKNKGGHVTVKCSEACFIIGIVSLTPRINYCQGNEFYLTDLLSMDDFHKPALDAIGFQDLIAERMAWWDTKIDSTGAVERSSIGKVPAWIEYMTAVDKCYGDFAETEGRGFMTLLRDYTREGNEIQDATTYIDPRKFNYAFAVNDIEAQNFWVQIFSDIKARRLMSAKQIPNI